MFNQQGFHTFLEYWSLFLGLEHPGNAFSFSFAHNLAYAYTGPHLPVLYYTELLDFFLIYIELSLSRSTLSQEA